MPISAALSSANTARTVGSDVSQRVLEHIAVETRCVAAELADRLQQRDALQDEGDGQHQVGQPVVLAAARRRGEVR